MSEGKHCKARFVVRGACELNQPEPEATAGIQNQISERLESLLERALQKNTQMS